MNAGVSKPIYVFPKSSRIRVPSIVKSGLVFWYDASNYDSYPESGTTWRDLTENANNGTLTGGSSWTSLFGGAMFFNGTNGYIDIANSNSLTITEKITMECWCRPDAVANATNGDGLISKGLSSDGNAGLYEIFLFPVSGVNTVRARFRLIISGVPTTVALNIGEIPISNLPYHIAFTFDGGIIRGYINGKIKGVTTSGYGTIESNSNGMALASRWTLRGSGVSDSHFTGPIFQSRIYNRDLSAKEVTRNYIAGLKSK